MRVVSVAGYKGVGKTTLVERLVEALGSHGRVATVKSIHHDVPIDEQATDTYRHRSAGADTVVGVTPGTTFQIDAEGKEDGITVFDIVQRLAADYDFVLVEGFKGADMPTIRVGDVAEPDLAGPVIATVEARTDPDIEMLVESILALEPWNERA
jgi:molybdopterin-guanine dinucleotide biosynthesis protein B